MLKQLHILLVYATLFVFLGRVVLLQMQSALMQQKWMKIAPHVITSLLLLTGIMLIMQGNWLAGEFGWLIAKILVLCGYIGLGLMVMKSPTPQRWYFLVGALLCFAYILVTAITKQAFWFI